MAVVHLSEQRHAIAACEARPRLTPGTATTKGSRAALKHGFGTALQDTAGPKRTHAARPLTKPVVLNAVSVRCCRRRTRIPRRIKKQNTTSKTTATFSLKPHSSSPERPRRPGCLTKSWCVPPRSGRSAADRCSRPRWSRITNALLAPPFSPRRWEAALGRVPREVPHAPTGAAAFRAAPRPPGHRRPDRGGAQTGAPRRPPPRAAAPAVPGAARHGAEGRGWRTAGRPPAGASR